MDFKAISFWIFAVMTVVPGLMIVLSRDIVRVAFWLLAALGGVAGLYVTLGADFLGFTQVLVYIGGIMVLILFGIMMTQKEQIPLGRPETSPVSILTGLLIAAVTAGALLLVVRNTTWRSDVEVGTTATTAGIGTELLTSYVLPFELVSVLLLVVLCGAAYIARRKAED